MLNVFVAGISVPMWATYLHTKNYADAALKTLMVMAKLGILPNYGRLALTLIALGLARAQVDVEAQRMASDG
jgi:hypothetical protein